MTAVSGLARSFPQLAAARIVTLAGLALGPFAVGRLSVAWGDLRAAMLCSLGANAIALACGLLAVRSFPRDEATKLARARAAGEVVT